MSLLEEILSFTNDLPQSHTTHTAAYSQNLSGISYDEIENDLFYTHDIQLIINSLVILLSRQYHNNSSYHNDTDLSRSAMFNDIVQHPQNPQQLPFSHYYTQYINTLDLQEYNTPHISFNISQDLDHDILDRNNNPINYHSPTSSQTNIPNNYHEYDERRLINLFGIQQHHHPIINNEYIILFLAIKRSDIELLALFSILRTLNPTDPVLLVYNIYKSPVLAYYITKLPNHGPEITFSDLLASLLKTPNNTLTTLLYTPTSTHFSLVAHIFNIDQQFYNIDQLYHTSSSISYQCIDSSSQARDNFATTRYTISHEYDDIMQIPYIHYQLNIVILLFYNALHCGSYELVSTLLSPNSHPDYILQENPYGFNIPVILQQNKHYINLVGLSESESKSKSELQFDHITNVQKYSIKINLSTLTRNQVAERVKTVKIPLFLYNFILGNNCLDIAILLAISAHCDIKRSLYTQKSPQIVQNKFRIMSLLLSMFHPSVYLPSTVTLLCYLKQMYQSETILFPRFPSVLPPRALFLLSHKNTQKSTYNSAIVFNKSLHQYTFTDYFTMYEFFIDCVSYNNIHILSEITNTHKSTLSRSSLLIFLCETLDQLITTTTIPHTIQFLSSTLSSSSISHTIARNLIDHLIQYYTHTYSSDNNNLRFGTEDDYYHLNIIHQFDDYEEVSNLLYNPIYIIMIHQNIPIIEKLALLQQCFDLLKISPAPPISFWFPHYLILDIIQVYWYNSILLSSLYTSGLATTLDTSLFDLYHSLYKQVHDDNQNHRHLHIREDEDDYDTELHIEHSPICHDLSVQNTIIHSDLLYYLQLTTYFHIFCNPHVMLHSRAKDGPLPQNINPHANLFSHCLSSLLLDPISTQFPDEYVVLFHNIHMANVILLIYSLRSTQAWLSLFEKQYFRPYTSQKPGPAVAPSVFSPQLFVRIHVVQLLNSTHFTCGLLDDINITPFLQNSHHKRREFKSAVDVVEVFFASIFDDRTLQEIGANLKLLVNSQSTESHFDSHISQILCHLCNGISIRCDYNNDTYVEHCGTLWIYLYLFFSLNKHQFVEYFSSKQCLFDLITVHNYPLVLLWLAIDNYNTYFHHSTLNITPQDCVVLLSFYLPLQYNTYNPKIHNKWVIAIFQLLYNIYCHLLDSGIYLELNDHLNLSQSTEYHSYVQNNCFPFEFILTNVTNTIYYPTIHEKLSYITRTCLKNQYGVTCEHMLYQLLLTTFQNHSSYSFEEYSAVSSECNVPLDIQVYGDLYNYSDAVITRIHTPTSRLPHLQGSIITPQFLMNNNIIKHNMVNIVSYLQCLYFYVTKRFMSSFSQTSKKHNISDLFNTFNSWNPLSKKIGPMVEPTLAVAQITSQFVEYVSTILNTPVLSYQIPKVTDFSRLTIESNQKHRGKEAMFQKTNLFPRGFPALFYQMRFNPVRDYEYPVLIIDDDVGKETEGRTPQVDCDGPLIINCDKIVNSKSYYYQQRNECIISPTDTLSRGVPHPQVSNFVLQHHEFAVLYPTLSIHTMLNIVYLTVTYYIELIEVVYGKIFQGINIHALSTNIFNINKTIISSYDNLKTAIIYSVRSQYPPFYPYLLAMFKRSDAQLRQLLANHVPQGVSPDDILATTLQVFEQWKTPHIVQEIKKFILQTTCLSHVQIYINIVDPNAAASPSPRKKKTSLTSGRDQILSNYTKLPIHDSDIIYYYQIISHFK